MDEAPNKIIEFSHAEETAYGATRHQCATLEGEEADFLPNVLREFTFFLNSIGFNYIDTVTAYGANGIEHTADL